MEQSSTHELKKLGYSTELSEGIVDALKNYKNVDVNKYLRLIHESLQYLRPRKETLPDLDDKPRKNYDLEKEEELIEERDEKLEDEKVETKPKDKNDEKTATSEESENIVLEIIKKAEGEDGAPWDLITEKCEKAGLDKDTIEETLNSLMDKGLIYEPVLGTIKST